MDRLSLDDLSTMETTGLRRKDTTKGPPLRVLSLGTVHPFEDSPFIEPDRN